MLSKIAGCASSLRSYETLSTYASNPGYPGIRDTPRAWRSGSRVNHGSIWQVCLPVTDRADDSTIASLSVESNMQVPVGRRWARCLEYLSRLLLSTQRETVRVFRLRMEMVTLLSAIHW